MTRAFLRPRLWTVVGLVAVGGLLRVTVDWRLLGRSLTYPDTPITSADWYQPQQLVPGVGPQAPPLVKVETTEIPPEALQKALDFAEEQNSVALLVMHRDRLVLEQYWQGHQASDPVNSMSMVKTLLALLIGVAIDEGHIGSIQDPVGTYLSEWANDPRGDITLADLLYMQSGLRNDNRIDTLRSDLVQLYGGSNTQKLVLDIPLESAPGKVFDYSNFNSQLLSLVLERATGESFGDYLSNRLWQPLGAGDGFLWLDRPRGSAKPFCCFFATAPDWVRLGQMLLHGGKVGDRQIIPASWLEQMLEESPLEPTFGMHIWLKARTADYPQVNRASSAAFAAADTFYLDGRHHQRVYVIPLEELVIVRLGEEPPAWNDAVIVNVIVEGLRSRQ
ncbi:MULTISPECIES: serine hydrolase domain-containing protein [Cyanophyceae]|uniref:Beta-lactamase family protein n=1 Tax=Leptolyngbya subtilissima DQ-A4 TaxID=2933933 RepID=A0ABV0K2J2_9CYAN|nr:serine hydrolase [Nodosilinea sp. FACHB-141]MBD2112959.1 serine hydrolase [Nodosilinea sp. FACHB-141]